MPEHARQWMVAVLWPIALLGVLSGCATLAGSWDYGLPKDHAYREDRL